MNQKPGYAIRIVLGGWLAYLGCSLFYQMYREKPENMVLMCIFAAVFVVFGAACVIHSLKMILDIRKEELSGADAASDDETAAAEEAAGKEEAQEVQTAPAPVQKSKTPKPADEEEIEADYEEK